MRKSASARANRPRRRHVVAAVVYDRLCTFEFGIAVEFFGLSRPEMPHWYEFVVCAAERPPLSATGGIKLVPRAGLEVLKRADTIILPGWRDLNETPPRALLDALVAAHRRGARLASICSGVFVLAATGLLDGRRATAHWRDAHLLRQAFPKIQVDPDVLYVDEGSVLTSAGSAAGIDLCMHLVRRDHGAKVANAVARRLLMAPHREGGQAQFIPAPVGDEDRPWLATLFDWVQLHLHESLPIDRMARQAHMSARTLTRRFVETAGVSPGEWLIGLRVARAKDLLETSRRSVERIADDCGFGSVATLRHHFRRRVHMNPAAYRARFHTGRAMT
ncbi:MAG TPA: transcriptional regulator FtrA [Gemmatimonadaceae bacterium]|nr:transcriptional regulator FtrA [Gemmatimonadaceae bacterium]